MGRNPQVCVACTHNCLLFHRPPTTSPTSFFKVMVRQNDSTILYIPPMFNRNVSALVNKKINLKDSSGRRWIVTVSSVDGSFAFEEGWNVFSLDHGLEIGDFLVFNFINKLDFDVKIYDESGCERLDFSKKRNQRKRSRGKSGSPDRGSMFVRQDPNASPVSKPDVPKMKSRHTEVDLGGTQNSAEDISKYDNDDGRVQSMCVEDKVRDDKTCSVDGTTKITTGDSKVSHVDYGSHVCQNDATLCNKYLVFERVLGTGDVSDASELEMSGRNNSLSETDKSVYNKTSTLKLEENKEHKSIMSNREVQDAEGLGEMKKVPVYMTPKLCSFNDTLHATGETSEKSEKEPVTPDVHSYKDELGEIGLPKVIKGDFGHSPHTFNQDNESHFETASTISCVVLTDNDCLKLPKCLPLSRSGRVRMERMVVLLRDPLRRLWPVLYHENSWLKILTDGWLDFQRANNIQPADVCVFRVENESERILAVHVVHK